MKACDKILAESIREALKLEEQQLLEDMKEAPPHVFSEKFELQMEEVMHVQHKKQRKITVLRYMAAAIMVFLLTAGMFFISSENLQASSLTVDILKWLEDFFSFEVGDENQYENREIFDESQIGYIPEEFTKSREVQTYSLVHIWYTSLQEQEISVKVSKGKAGMTSDYKNEKAQVFLNDAGYECTVVVIDGVTTLMWMDHNNLYYILSGNVDSEELMKIMNGISYE